MGWTPDKGRAVCPQICEHICVRIARGELAADERLPSVREFAVQIGVNPNTVQHAFDRMEQQGVLYSVRTVGWFVRGDRTVAEQTVAQIAREKTAAFFAEMENLGMEPAAVKRFVEEWSE